MELQKMKVKYPAALKITFREKGVFSNIDYVIVDMNSYEFIGVLADDYIHGRYDKEGYYDIMYFYTKSTVGEEKGGKPHIYRINFRFPFPKDDFFYDFEQKLIRIGEQYELAFNGIVTEKDVVERILKTNCDLIIV